MDLSSYLDLQPNPNIPEFGPGDTVRVSAKVVEGEREKRDEAQARKGKLAEALERLQGAAQSAPALG